MQQQKNNQVTFFGANSRMWIYSTIALAIALAVVLYLGLMGQLFYTPMHSAENHILLGDDVRIYLENDAANVSTLAFNGSSLPGDTVLQNINLHLPFEGEDSYVRANFYVTSSNGERNVIGINLLNDWMMALDGYYYYVGPLTKGQTVALTDAIILPENMQLRSSYVYTIIISVETMKAGLPVLEIWNTMPPEIVPTP